MSYDWIFITAVLLVTPMMVLITGLRGIKRANGAPNYKKGYRTPASTASPEAWKFAQKHFGQLCMRLGIVLMVLTFVVMFMMMGAERWTLGIVLIIMIVVQNGAWIACSSATERAIRANFDKHGQRMIMRDRS